MAHPKASPVLSEAAAQADARCDVIRLHVMAGALELAQAATALARLAYPDHAESKRWERALAAGLPVRDRLALVHLGPTGQSAERCARRASRGGPERLVDAGVITRVFVDAADEAPCGDRVEVETLWDQVVAHEQELRPADRAAEVFWRSALQKDLSIRHQANWLLLVLGLRDPSCLGIAEVAAHTLRRQHPDHTLLAALLARVWMGQGRRTEAEGLAVTTLEVVPAKSKAPSDLVCRRLCAEVFFLSGRPRLAQQVRPSSEDSWDARPTLTRPTITTLRPPSRRPRRCNDP